MPRTAREKELYAHHLRRDMTAAERALWAELRRLGGWKTQSVQHGYILDFYYPARQLCVEVDGSIHDRPDVAAHDKVRQGHLEKHGIQVLRFTNAEVLTSPRKVAQRIKSCYQPVDWRATFRKLRRMLVG
jgi:cyclase